MITYKKRGIKIVHNTQLTTQVIITSHNYHNMLQLKEVYYLNLEILWLLIMNYNNCKQLRDNKIMNYNNCKQLGDNNKK